MRLSVPLNFSYQSQKEASRVIVLRHQTLAPKQLHLRGIRGRPQRPRPMLVCGATFHFSFLKRIVPGEQTTALVVIIAVFNIGLVVGHFPIGNSVAHSHTWHDGPINQFQLCFVVAVVVTMFIVELVQDGSYNGFVFEGIQAASAVASLL